VRLTWAQDFFDAGDDEVLYSYPPSTVTVEAYRVIVPAAIQCLCKAKKRVSE
jgi:hypothetical protein